MDGPNLSRGKAGSYKKWKLAPAFHKSDIRQHNPMAWIDIPQPSSRPVATFESPTAAEPGQRIRHS